MRGRNWAAGMSSPKSELVCSRSNAGVDSITTLGRCQNIRAAVVNMASHSMASREKLRAEWRSKILRTRSSFSAKRRCSLASTSAALNWAAPSSRCAAHRCHV